MLPAVASDLDFSQLDIQQIDTLIQRDKEYADSRRAQKQKEADIASEIRKQAEILENLAYDKITAESMLNHLKIIIQHAEADFSLSLKEINGIKYRTSYTDKVVFSYSRSLMRTHRFYFDVAQNSQFDKPVKTKQIMKLLEILSDYRASLYQKSYSLKRSSLFNKR